MPTELLLNPQLHERGFCLTAKETLAACYLEQAAVVNDKFEGNLQGDVVRSRTSRRLRNPRPEMLGASWRRLAVAAIVKEVAQCDAQRRDYRLGRAGLEPTVEQHLVVFVGDAQRGMMIVIGWTADRPFPVEFTPAAAPLNNRQRPLSGRTGQGGRGAGR
jgi:hypothetical protein